MGCTATTDEDDVDIRDGALQRTSPTAQVPTTDNAVHLLGGYNALLDHGTAPCVVPDGAETPVPEDLSGKFYLQHIQTRQDLAKALDVDVQAGVQLPQASVNAGTKVVTSFKQSSSSVTFLVRAVRSYSVSRRGAVKLTPEASALLSSNRTNDFLVRCGGSWAKSVRYEAEVVAILQFDASSEESARDIRTDLGVSSPGAIKQVTSASADVKTQAQQTASKHKAALSLTVHASGFLTQNRSANVAVENSFEKIDELRTDMNASFDADLALDRAGYAPNKPRNVRPAMVVQAPYSEAVGAPAGASVARVSTTLGRAEEFLTGLAGPRLRMEAVYADEVGRFLSDTQDQFRYNLVSAPKLRTRDLTTIAQKWGATFAPDAPRASGSLVEPLRAAAETCLRAAGAGDYSACVTDSMLERTKADAEAALAEYARNGRIVKMQAWMPTLGETMSYRNADEKCRDVSMRVPRRDEMPFIAPAVTALAGSLGEVWFAGDSQCSKPAYANGSGEGRAICLDTVGEPLPYVSDRPVVCVGRGGPVVVLAAP